MIGRMTLATVVIPLLLAVLLLAVLLWTKRRIIAGSILLGALLGGVVGFWVGVALGPGSEAGSMYGIEQLASGTVVGSWGVLVGAILGGTSGWAFSAWRRRERHRQAGGSMAGLGPGSIVAVVTVWLAVLTTSCAHSSHVAPFGLESVTLPQDSDQIGAVLGDMPRTLRGLDVNGATTEDSQLGLSYGADRDLALVATDWSTGKGGFPAWTAGEFLPRFAKSGEVDIDESDLEGPILWFTGENHSFNGQGEVLKTFWTMWWGAPSSGWVFAVNAPSEEDGIALVEAFAEAVSKG